MKKSFIVISLMILAIFSLTYCTKNDGILNLNPPEVASTGDTLFSVKVASGPTLVTAGATWSGADTVFWKNAPKLTETVTVPEVIGDVVSFSGFIGNSNKITMQSVYDANNVYFFVQWDQAQPNMESSPWYYNTITKRWAQGGAAPTYDVNGILTLQSFVSDQFDVIFNINNSCAGFVTQSCYGACHQNVNSLVMDPVTGNITSKITNVMHTNGPSEKLDCWRARMYFVMNASQAIDYYIDWNGGVPTANAVHGNQSVSNGANPPVYSSTAATNGTGGTSNTQSLIITGTSTKANVPLWVKPSGSYLNAAMLPSDTTGSGSAVKVIAVDTTGILTLKNGATLNPNTGTTYQQVGTGIGNNDQTSWIPGKIVAPYTGLMGNVAANAHWTGKGWQLLLKRALKTPDVLQQDVDFSSLATQQFGIALMFQPIGSKNAADNQHAIKPGMTLKFKQ